MTKQAPSDLRKFQRMIFLLGLFKIPIVGYIRPKLLLINEDEVHVSIKLRRRTKNHLGSMYFGALAVGADIAGGIHAFYFAQKEKSTVSFAFKGMKAEFIQRAESTTLFKTTDGQLVKKAIQQSLTTGERVNQAIQVNAFNLEKQLVATFEMIISVKVQAVKP